MEAPFHDLIAGDFDWARSTLPGRYHSALIDGGRTSRSLLRSCLLQTATATSSLCVPGTESLPERQSRLRRDGVQTDERYMSCIRSKEECSDDSFKLPTNSPVSIPYRVRRGSAIVDSTLNVTSVHLDSNHENKSHSDYMVSIYLPLLCNA